MAQAMRIASELFDIANSFAGEKTGPVAAWLHQGTSSVWEAKKVLDQIEQPPCGPRQVVEFAIAANMTWTEEKDHEYDHGPRPCACGSATFSLIKTADPIMQEGKQVYPQRVALRCDGCGIIGQDTCHGKDHAIRRWNWYGEDLEFIPDECVQQVRQEDDQVVVDTRLPQPINPHEENQEASRKPEVSGTNKGTAKA